MLEVNHEFVLKWAGIYDAQYAEGKAKTEDTIRRWLCALPEPKYLNKDMFVQLCEWKSPRPREHYRANRGAAIEEVTRKAYAVPDSLSKLKLLDASLKGVGVAVAACILHYLQPNEYAIFDYRAVNTLRKAGLWKRGKGDASAEAWLEYVGLMKDKARTLDVTLRQLDKALFAYDKKYPTRKPCR